MSPPTVLVADDDAAICTVLEQAIKRQGFRVITTDSTATLIGWVESGKGDLVITDVAMPDGNGLDMLPRIKEMRPELPVIVISAQNTLMTAVKANERGAYEYLPKPFDLNELMMCVEKSMATRPVNPAGPPIEGLRDALPLIGSSPAMQDIYRVLARLVANDLTVMITGESGTGKEMVARALHSLSRRKDKPFTALNMAAIPRELVESELFGHEKGAFTGATARKSGSFEQAEGGTLFLDEIGDMPLDAQTRLLRVLQQGEFTTVGGTKPIKTDVRIVCATHRDLQQLIGRGEFREDLFFRLNVVPVRIPALRERKGDIAVLASYFLRKASEKGLAYKELDASAEEILKGHAWPGNVRELENMMYRIAALTADPVIDAATLRRELAENTDALKNSSNEPSLSDAVRQHLRTYFAGHQGALPSSGLHERILDLVERPLIELTLDATHGNQLKAAQVLGINRNTLRKKIQDLGIGKIADGAEG